VEQDEPVPILPIESRKVLEIVMAIKASLENGGESVRV